MEIRQITYVLETASTLNISQAAKNLFISQQALSKAIHIIEIELGHALFVRRANTLFLTTFGEFFVKQTKPFLADYSKICGKLHEFNHSSQKSLSLACSHSVVHALNLLNMMKSSKDLHLKIYEMPDIEVEEKVYNKTYDLGLSIGFPLKHIECFEIIPLQHFSFCTVSNPNYFNPPKTELSLLDISHYPIIIKNEQYKIYHILKHFEQKNHLTLNYSLISPDEVLWMKWVVSGRGIGIGVSFINAANEDPLRENLTFATLNDYELFWDVNLIMRKDASVSKKRMDLLVHFLKT